MVEGSSASSSRSDNPTSTYDVDPTSYPDAEQEITPGMALVLLLQGILELMPGLEMEWVFNRLHLEAKFARKLVPGRMVL